MSPREVVGRHEFQIRASLERSAFLVKIIARSSLRGLRLCSCGLIRTGCNILDLKDYFNSTGSIFILILRIIMARFYHVDIARFAANADQKWVDNLLSHYDVPGVDGAKQGLARRISAVGVYHIALIRSLTRDAGISTAQRRLSECTAADPRRIQLFRSSLVWSSASIASVRAADRRRDQRSRRVDRTGAPRPPAEERYRQPLIITSRSATPPCCLPKATRGTRWVPLVDAERPARELPSDLAHVLRGRSLLTLDEVELDGLALGERLEAVAGDGAVVDEAVLVSTVWRDEPKPLRVVEPLHLSGRTHVPLLKELVRSNTMLRGRNT